MARKSAVVCLVAAALSAALASAAAGACSDRPGTPDNVRIELLSPTSIRFHWRITTRNDEPNRYYDLQVFEEIPPRSERNGSNVPKKILIHNLAGVSGQGPYFRGYGGMDFYSFSGLKPATKYCVWIAARTKPGTQGCTSAVHSAQPCATTAGEPAPPPPKEPTKVPEITAYWLEGNVFRVEGKYFRPNASVVLKVSGAAAAKPSVTAKADAQGNIDVKYSDLCARSGPLTFSTTPGIKRFISRASVKCQLPGYTPNRKLPL